jgi:hypothetical protein
MKTKTFIFRFLKSMTFVVIVFIAFLSTYNLTYSQSGLPCDEALTVPPGSNPPNPSWVHNQNDNNSTVNIPECPGCTITSYTYSKRQYTDAQGIPFTDLIITGYTTNGACNNCNINFFEKILWSIWMSHKNEWGLDPLGCLENYRVSAASCWRTTIGTLVESHPCSSECCSQLYTVCRASNGDVFFRIINPVPFTNNCTVSPCTYFVCDKLSNIDITEQESNDLRNANPQFLGKKQVYDKQGLSVSILPNPSTGIISLEIKNVLNEILTIKVTDIMGNVIYIIELLPSNGYLFTNVSLQNIQSGSYIAIIQQSGKTIYSENIKLIK